MKKQYICPQTMTTMIKTEQHLLAGSANGDSVFDGTPASTENPVLSRRQTSFWGEEEDEEY